MQAEDMEVPIINNLNDNGDRLRPKGKDAFKEPQKESEVNLGLVVVCGCAVQERVGAVRAKCMSVCVCVMCALLPFRPAPCPPLFFLHAAGRSSSLGPGACMRADMQAARHRGVILASGSYK